MLGRDDETVILKEAERLSEDDTVDHVASISYDIYNRHGFKVGSIDLRLTMNDWMYYYGHIGYRIRRFYRGHHYAYRACLELFKIAKDEFGMNSLIITCNPDNIASIKTIEKLQPEFIERVKVPANHELYRLNEREKLIFRVNL